MLRLSYTPSHKQIVPGMRRAWGWPLLAFFLLFGCDSDGNAEESVTSAVGLNKDSQFVYRWAVNEIDTTSGVAILLFEDEFVVRVAGTDERVGDQEGLLRVDVTSAADPAVTSTTWYRETGTDLFEIAHRNAGTTPIVAPKRGGAPVAPPALFSLLHADPPRPTGSPDAMADSIVVRDEPRLVFQFPLEPGKRWTAFSTPFEQTRAVIAVDTATTPAGAFPCAQIRTEAPSFAPNLDWIDCVSEEGLITRYLENDAPGIGGRVRLRERLTLISKTK